MKRKEIIEMIDKVMKEVDVSMDDRDYDTAACKLSDLMWAIRDDLMKKIKGGNKK